MVLSVVSNGHRTRNLLRSKANSGTRIMKERAAATAALADNITGERLRAVAKPNDPSKTMRKVGLALLISPDPITDIPGAIILGASIAAKKREPLSAASVSEEIRRVLREIGFSFR